jgi:hypothetical protein
MKRRISLDDKSEKHAVSDLPILAGNRNSGKPFDPAIRVLSEKYDSRN